MSPSLHVGKSALHASTVIGVGRAQTPKSFVNACNTFITIETLERDARRRPR